MQQPITAYEPPSVARARQSQRNMEQFMDIPPGLSWPAADTPDIEMYGELLPRIDESQVPF